MLQQNGLGVFHAVNSHKAEHDITFSFLVQLNEHFAKGLADLHKLDVLK